MLDILPKPDYYKIIWYVLLY